MQGGGWSTAEDAKAAYHQYSGLLESIKKDDIARVRVALAFCLHLAEGAGFYEMPKKMMLTIDGKGNREDEIKELTEAKKCDSSSKIAPP